MPDSRCKKLSAVRSRQEQRAHRANDFGDHRAGLHCSAVFDQQTNLNSMIDEIKNPVEQHQTGDHAVLFGAEQPLAPGIRRDRRHGRQIAGADIFVQRSRGSNAQSAG